ncbi:MAG: HAD hydrolase family protein [Proteobacteria bacterium]|nr:HAD hydrolase family protein [Pseudomonadota bacterium]
MLNIVIPGFKPLQLLHLLLDYNGTLAAQGHLVEGVAPALQSLSKKLKLHVITGDTFGSARNELAGLDCQLLILPSEDQATAKLHYLQQLPSDQTVAIGNGRNDQYMLKQAALGIAVIGPEGAAIEAMQSANLVVSHILHALGLLEQPRRLVATLRC